MKYKRELKLFSELAIGSRFEIPCELFYEKISEERAIYIGANEMKRGFSNNFRGNTVVTLIERVI